MDKPFSLISPKLASVRGKVNRNLPPIANKIAKMINATIIRDLRPFEIFFEEILLIYLNKMYKTAKITNV